MLGLIIVALWTVFVCGYLVWQQVTGDLAGEETVSSLPPAFNISSYQPGVAGRGLTADS
jgi:hypothetical protein